MFYATVFSLCVFSYCDQINVIVCCGIALYGPARPYIGIQIKNPGEGRQCQKARIVLKRILLAPSSQSFSLSSN